MRYFLRISFDGTRYHGWQIQLNAHSVQAEINKALSVLLRMDVETIGCGRTDTGVHARKYFLHFDAEKLTRDIPDFIHQLNCILPNDIAVQDLLEVEPNAHARYDAVERTYEYSLHFVKDPFLQNSSVYSPHKPEIERMNVFSKILLDYNDFSCFSKSRTQTLTTICKLTSAYWEEIDDRMIFRISADRFLRNMVRAIVGTLLEAGLNKIDEAEFRAILNSKNRSEAGPSVPAHGLFLTDVRYPYL